MSNFKKKVSQVKARQFEIGIEDGITGKGLFIPKEEYEISISRFPQIRATYKYKDGKLSLKENVALGNAVFKPYVITPAGKTVINHSTDWIVDEGDARVVYTNAQFQREFEAIPEPAPQPTQANPTGPGTPN